MNSEWEEFKDECKPLEDNRAERAKPKPLEVKMIRGLSFGTVYALINTVKQNRKMISPAYSSIYTPVRRKKI